MRPKPRKLAIGHLTSNPAWRGKAGHLRRGARPNTKRKGLADRGRLRQPLELSSVSGQPCFGSLPWRSRKGLALFSVCCRCSTDGKKPGQAKRQTKYFWVRRSASAAPERADRNLGQLLFSCARIRPVALSLRDLPNLPGALAVGRFSCARSQAPLSSGGALRKRDRRGHVVGSSCSTHPGLTPGLH